MKTRLIFTLICMFALCFSVKGQNSISIADERYADASKSNYVSHREKDVVISRIDIPGKEGKFYLINMYRMDSGKLSAYPFCTSASEDYNKATYKWTNDTTIFFTLINSFNSRSESFRMSGNGKRSDLERK